MAKNIDIQTFIKMMVRTTCSCNNNTCEEKEQKKCRGTKLYVKYIVLNIINWSYLKPSVRTQTDTSDYEIISHSISRFSTYTQMIKLNSHKRLKYTLFTAGHEVFSDCRREEHNHISDDILICCSAVHASYQIMCEIQKISGGCRIEDSDVFELRLMEKRFS